METKNRLILVLLLGGVAAIGPFAIDMYLPAFKAMGEYFNVNETVLSYTLTSYFIGISIGQLIYGPLLDRYGRKKPLLVGMVLYGLASLMCAQSQELYTLIFFRFLQALGGSVGMVASVAIVKDLFSTEEVARTLSSILLVMGVAPVIAPSLGSFLLKFYDWHAIFVFLGIFAFVLAICLFVFLKESLSPHLYKRDTIGTILKNYKDTLQVSSFSLLSLSGSISMAIMFAYLSSISTILLTIYGVSTSFFGILFATNASGFILGSQLNNLFIKKRDLYRFTKQIACIQMVLATVFVLVAFNLSIPLYVFIGYTFSMLFLLGFLSPNTTALCLKEIKKNVGIASALNGSFRMALGSFASMLVGVFSNATIYPLLVICLVLSLCAYILIVLGKSKK